MTAFRVTLTLRALDPGHIDDVLANLERIAATTGPVVATTGDVVDITVVLDAIDAVRAVSAAAALMAVALDGSGAAAPSAAVAAELVTA